MARDRVAEIAEVRSRARWRDSQAVSEVATLRHQWDGGGGPLGCAPDYAAIRLVTLIEVYMRNRSAELIDSGSPYLERAQSLVGTTGLKIDFPLAAAISGKKISLGQLVAHTIPCNSFGDFVNCFSKLFDADLFNCIRDIHDRVAVELLGEAKSPIIGDVPSLCSVMVRLFESRHILVHELPDQTPIGEGDIDRYIEMTHQILRATDGHVDWLLHGDYPLTQTDMNIEAGESAAEVDRQLALLVDRIREGGRDEEFEKAQSAWEAYREAEADFRTGWGAGGTIRPMLHAAAFETLTRERLEALESFVAGKFDLGGPQS